jgi:SH2 domain/Protein tyrosine and serine/threonine kinase
MLWEFLTRKPPFPHHRDFETFKHAVSVKGERPEIPATCVPSLKKLMRKCWHKEPQRRPSFPRIVRALEHIIVDVAITDEVGRKFWKDNMIEEEAIDNPIEVVEWEDFLVFFAGFLEPMGEPLPDDASLDQIRSATINQVNDFQQRSDRHFHRVLEAFQDNDRDLEWDDPEELLKHIEWQCLHAILAEQTKDGREIVRMSKFGQVLNWFGPLEMIDEGPLAAGGFLDRIRNVLKEPWFHGNVSGQVASKSLLDKEPGAFLVRFSSQPGSFAVSKVGRSKTITHVRIQHTDQKYWLEGSTATFPTLGQVIDNASSKLFLQEACPGSPFGHLFVSDETKNYVPTDGGNNYLVCDFN